jgi:hypothetical protein
VSDAIASRGERCGEELSCFNGLACWMWCVGPERKARSTGERAVEMGRGGRSGQG